MFIKLEIFRYKSAYISTNAVFCLLIEFEKKKKKKKKDPWKLWTLFLVSLYS